MSNLAIRLINKAVKEAWPVTDRNKQKAVKVITDILDNDEKEDKLKLSAARTLVMIDGINVKREENEIRKQPKHVIHHKDLTDAQLEEQLLARLEEMGIKHVPTAALPSLIGEENENENET